VLLLAAAAAAEVVDVFAPAPAPAGVLAKPGAPGVRRVTLAAGAAARLQAGLPTDGSTTLRLDLGGEVIVGTIDRVDQVGPAGVRVHRLRPVGKAQDSVLIAAHAGTVVAAATGGHHGAWTVLPDGDGHRVESRAFPGRECDCDRHAPDAGGAVAAKIMSAPSAPSAPTSASDAAGTPTIQVMVLYTPIVAARLGGHAAAVAWSALAVAQLDQAFAVSGPVVVNGQTFPGPLANANLVHAQQVEYLGGADLRSDLDRLTATNDGIIDEAHALRDQHGADLVCLLVESSGPIIGIGWILPVRSRAAAAFGFNVCDWAGAVVNHTLVHEVGHNLGCGHDRGNGDGIDSFAHGHLWEDPADGSRFRTVMSYNRSPGFQRLNRFANPDVLVRGQPSGKPIGDAEEACDAATVALSVRSVASFRAAARPRILSEGALWLRPENGLSYALRVNDHQFDPGTTLAWSLSGPAGLTINGAGVLALSPGAELFGRHLRAQVTVDASRDGSAAGRDRQEVVIYVREPQAPAGSN